MLSLPTDTNEIMVLGTSSHYLEKVDIAKIMKMGSLHASQKRSFSRKNIFFVFNYQNIGCKLLPKA